jgi:aldose 1-epimerase
MNAVPSGAQFEIVAGPHRATLVEVGGGIRTLICDRHAVLDGYPRQEMRTGARGTRLIPWPNRLADGVYDFRGTRYQVALTEPEAHNAIHGFLRWRNWTLRERATDRVVLGTVLHPLPGYPFTLDISIDYSFLDAAGGDRQTGLAVATTATNLGDTPCPYATGHHPYLTAGTEFINECTLTLDAHTWLPTDDRGLPTGTESVEDTPDDFRTGALIGNTVIDYAFTGLTRDGNGLAWVYLTAPDGRCTRLWADEHYRFIELYTGDTQPPNKQRRGLGVEPMTCASNDFQAGNNLIILDPGQSITTRWGLHPHQP